MSSLCPHREYDTCNPHTLPASVEYRSRREDRRRASRRLAPHLPTNRYHHWYTTFSFLCDRPRRRNQNHWERVMLWRYGDDGELSVPCSPASKFPASSWSQDGVGRLPSSPLGAKTINGNVIRHGSLQLSLATVACCPWPVACPASVVLPRFSHVSPFTC
jgi:hypothetical protein